MKIKSRKRKQNREILTITISKFYFFCCFFRWRREAIECFFKVFVEFQNGSETPLRDFDHNTIYIFLMFLLDFEWGKRWGGRETKREKGERWMTNKADISDIGSPHPTLKYVQNPYRHQTKWLWSPRSQHPRQQRQSHGEGEGGGVRHAVLKKSPSF